VQRQLTHIPATREITRVPDPVVTKLYRKELLQNSSQEEFFQLWDA